MTVRRIGCRSASYSQYLEQKLALADFCSIYYILAEIKFSTNIIFNISLEFKFHMKYEKNIKSNTKNYRSSLIKKQYAYS